MSAARRPDPGTAPIPDHAAAARRILAETESRVAAILSGQRGELTTQRVLADRVRTEHDLQRALVHALLDIAQAVREAQR